MKTRFSFLPILFATAMLFSCTKNPTPKEATLGGTWHLTNVSGGFVGLDLDYDKGDVRWHFNQTTHELTVTNNIVTTGPKSIYARFSSGTYTYVDSIINGLPSLYIDGPLIDGQNIGTYTFTQTTLLIDEGVAADGFLYTFSR